MRFGSAVDACNAVEAPRHHAGNAGEALRVHADDFSTCTNKNKKKRVHSGCRASPGATLFQSALPTSLPLQRLRRFPTCKHLAGERSDEYKHRMTYRGVTCMCTSPPELHLVHHKSSNSFGGEPQVGHSWSETIFLVCQMDFHNLGETLISYRRLSSYSDPRLFRPICWLGVGEFDDVADKCKANNTHIVSNCWHNSIKWIR